MSGVALPRPRARQARRRAGQAAWLAMGLLLLVPLADLAAVAVVWSPQYLARLVAWRAPGPDDLHRFPARPIAAGTALPLPPADPAGPGLLRAAFAQLHPGAALEDFATRTHTTSLLVVHGGRLLYEGYFNGARRGQKLNSFSMAKSVTALLAGAAMQDGLLPPPSTPAAAVLPDVPGLRAPGLELRHLLAMTSGFAVFDPHRFGPLSTAWSEYRLEYFAPDLRRVAAGVRPLVPPGARFFYDDRNPMLIGMALERATGGSVSAYLQRRLWQPMGAAFPADWSLDSRTHGFEHMETGLNAAAVDFLRLGLLVRARGVAADGTRLLPAAWIEAITAPPAGPAGRELDAHGKFYGMFWWGYPRPGSAPDVFADGVFGQVLMVSPGTDTVLLRTGDGEGGADWPVLLRDLATFLARP